MDEAGILHVIGDKGYRQSLDAGVTWQTAVNSPAGWTNGGIYGNGSELMIAGKLSDKPAFMRSYDGGSTWEEPTVVSSLNGYLNQMFAEPEGRYSTILGNQVAAPHYFLQSADFGDNWSEPEYLGSGDHIKLLKTSTGELLLISIWQDPTRVAGFRKFQLPAGVDAPDHLSLWEKSAFNYNFKVLGTGTVEVSLPVDYISVDQNPTVTVGAETVSGQISSKGNRLIVSFPVSASDWTACTLPISVLKGNVSKFKSIEEKMDSLGNDFAAAVAIENGEQAAEIYDDISLLKSEGMSAERDIDVSLKIDGSVIDDDQTYLAIFEKLTQNYVHFKAGSKTNEPPKLVLLSEDEISVGINEPFRLEIKTTNITKGAIAQTAINGAFEETLDVIESSATGMRKNTYYLFYSQDFEGDSDTIDITVTVNGFAISVPFTVNLY